jgi:putative ABC transport system permease protein
MQALDTLGFAVRNISRHPLRAALAVLSTAIGVATLVIIVSGERSWQRALDDWYEQRGVDVIVVGDAEHRPPNLPEEAAATQRFLNACRSVSSATPVADGWSSVKSGKTEAYCYVRGVLPGFERVFGTRLVSGRFFTAGDEEERARACILDASLARVLFGSTDLVGREIRVGGYRMEVVGIAADLTSGGLEARLKWGGDEVYQEDAERFSARLAGLAVPLSTARRSLGFAVARLAARAPNHAVAVPELAQHFHLDARPAQSGRADRAGTGIFSLASERAAAVAARGRVRVFVGLAAVLVLFSSGVAVACVMYAAVNQRTREIGVHRAHGATRGAVAWALLCESLLLGAAGGLFGLGLGLLGAHGLGTLSFPHPSAGEFAGPLAQAMSLLPGMRVFAEWRAAVVAVVAGLAVVALASYLPAGEAASLDPSRAIGAGTYSGHTLRQWLTGLQVAVGVTALLLLTSMHEGMALEQLGGISTYGQPDTVLTFLTTTKHKSQMEPIADPMKRLVLDPDRVQAIARECSLFRSIQSQAYIDGASHPLKSGRYSIAAPNSSFSGVTAGFFAAERMRPVEGRFFTGEEVAAGSRVVVLTDAAASWLGLDTAAGEVVRIGGLRFEVVGVADRGTEAASEWAYLPITAVPPAWTAGYPYTGCRLRAHLRSESGYQKAERQLLAALAKQLPKATMDHIVLSGKQADVYRLRNLRRGAALRASVIGFSALLIALIGLVNMLLVSVAEQTREIGLRRALGATRGTIARAVVAEALLICVPGCAAGLGLGITASRLLGNWAHLATAVPAFWIIVSAGAALGGGVLVSVLPAFRASLVAPVVALRHE